MGGPLLERVGKGKSTLTQRHVRAVATDVTQNIAK
jgi:hypothetical protein